MGYNEQVTADELDQLERKVNWVRRAYIILIVLVILASPVWNIVTGVLDEIGLTSQ